MEDTTLTLYPAVGKPVVWQMKKEEVAVLQEALSSYKSSVMRHVKAAEEAEAKAAYRQ